MAAALGLVTLGYLLVIGYAFYLTWWLGVAALVLALVLVAASSRATGALVGARIVTPEQEPRVHGMLERLCQLADVPKPALALIDSSEPNAFAAGAGRHGTIFVTTALAAQLSDRELQAVIAHELAHIVNRDSLIMAAAWFLPLVGGLVTALGIALTGAARGGGWVGLILAFAGLVLAAMGIVGLVVGVLIALGLSRAREFAADRFAGRLTGDPQSLSRVLARLATAPSDARLAPLAALLIRPPRLTAHSFISTHPSLAARTRRLELLSGALPQTPLDARGSSAVSAAIIAAGPLCAVVVAVAILLIGLSNGG
jgi:heat shock protein HtpX